MNTKLTAFVVPGLTGFVAAKFVFDASTTKAIITGIVIGAIAITLISIKTPQPIITP